MTMPEPQDKITIPSEPLEATMTKRLIAAAAATALGASAASAEPPTIPPEFWGEWCTPQQDPNDANKSWYTLPSQTRNGLCIQVLAIFKEGFRFNAGATGNGYEQCRPTEIEFTKNAGPSGTGYTIKVIAFCFEEFRSPDEVKTFEIHRDQGRLSVTNLPRN
jgi:hypothetical protein